MPGDEGSEEKPILASLKQLAEAVETTTPTDKPICHLQHTARALGQPAMTTRAPTFS